MKRRRSLPLAIGVVKAVLDDVHRRHGLGAAHTRLESGVQQQPLVASRGGDWSLARSGMSCSAIASGAQKAGRMPPDRAMEAGRSDTHHGVGLPVQHHRTAENARVGAEPVLPESMTENHHRVAPKNLIVWRQDGAAERRVHAHYGKVVAADDLTPDALRVADPAQARGNKWEVGAYALESLCGLIAIVDVVRIRKGVRLRRRSPAARGLLRVMRPKTDRSPC